MANLLIRIFLGTLLLSQLCNADNVEGINTCNSSQANPIDLWHQSKFIEIDKEPTNVEQYMSKLVQLETEYTRRWDVELNKTYQLLMKNLNKADQQQLKEAQRAWLKFYKSDTLLAQRVNKNGGAVGKYNAAQTNSKYTRDRTCDLKLYLFNVLYPGQ